MGIDYIHYLFIIINGGNSFGRAKVDLTCDVIILLRMNGI